MDQAPVFLDITTKTYTYFKEDVFKIGRSSSCDVEITSTFVSRLQCLVEKDENGSWVIEDKSTFCNSLVNGKKVIGRLALKDGDVVSFLNCSEVKGLIFYHQHPDSFTPRKKRKREEGVLEAPVIDVEEEPEAALQTQPRRNEPDGESSGSLLFNPTYRTVIHAYEEEHANLRKKVEELTKEIESLKEPSSRLEPVPKLNLSPSVIEVNETGVDSSEDVVDDSGWRNFSFDPFDDNGELLHCDGSSSEMESSKPISNPDLKGITPVSQISDNGTVHLLGPLRASSDDYSSEVDRVELIMLREKVAELNQDLQLKDELIAKETQERNSFRNCVIETLENYLMCGICNDIIYEAVTLPCKHTFCSVCLNEWKKSKKECPICLSKFKTEVSTLILDSFAEKLIDVIGGETKSRRQEVIKDRERPPAARPSPRERNNRNNPGRGARYQRRRQPRGNPFSVPYLFG